MSQKTAIILSVFLLITPIPFIAEPIEGDDQRSWINDGPKKEIRISDSSFIQNLGQIDDHDVLFYSRSGNVFFTSTGVYYRFGEVEPIYQEEFVKYPFKDLTKEIPIACQEKGVVLKNNFIGSNRVIPEGRERCSWSTNYFLGNDTTRWRIGVPSFYEVVYTDLWDGIDLIYRMKDGYVKYDLILHKGADPNQICFSIEGHEYLEMNEHGDMIIHTLSYSILDEGLVSKYLDGDREIIPCHFSIRSPSNYGFELYDYDTEREVVIDPLLYSTYLGGSDSEFGNDVAIGQNKKIYTVGTTLSPDFPNYVGEYNISRINTALFISVLEPDLSSLCYSVLIGGTKREMGGSICIDPSDNVYVGGTTNSSDFPITSISYDASYNGDNDTFIIRLNSTISNLEYSTYLGGSSYEGPTPNSVVLTIDQDNNVFITGCTNSTDFPTTPGSYNTTLNPGGSDGYIAKLNSTLSSLIFSTFIGGGSYDVPTCIDIDQEGNSFISGFTCSLDYPTTNGAYDTSFNGGEYGDSFVTKIDQNGSALIYSTLIGGSESDVCGNIAIDPSDNAYIVGYTASNEYPTTNGAYDTSYNGGGQWGDIFVTKIDQNGSALVYSTFIGGSKDESGGDIVIGPSGYVYISGGTSSSDYPTNSWSYDPNHNGNWDCFVTKLNIDRSTLSYSTFIGGSKNDYGAALSLDSSNNVILCGMTSSDDYPTTSGAFETVFKGKTDAFISILNPNIHPIANAGLDQIINEDTIVDFNATWIYDMNGLLNYTWSISSKTSNIILFGPTPSYFFSEPGLYEIELAMTDFKYYRERDIARIMVLDITDPIANAGPDLIVNEDTLVLLKGSRSVDNVEIVTYVWTFIEDSRSVTLYGMQTFYEFKDPGSYEVTLNVSDAAGNWDCDTLNVTVLDITAPIANAGSDIYADEDTLVTLNGSRSKDIMGILNWTWSFEDNGRTIILYGENTTHVFEQPGDYPVTLEVSDPNNHSGKDVVDVHINDVTPPVADAGCNKIVDIGSIALFNASASYDNVGIKNYSWWFQDGFGPVALFGKKAYHTFLIEGIYRITLNVTDEAGNWAVSGLNITVVDISPPIADAGMDRSVEEDKAIIFDGTGSTDTVGIINWTWTFNDGNRTISLYGKRTYYIFFDPGEYLIALIVADEAGNTAQDIIMITVIDVTAPIANAGTDFIAAQSQTVMFDGSYSSDNVGIVDWKWTIAEKGTVSVLSGITVSYVFTDPDIYEVLLTVSDEAGNIGEDRVRVGVRDSIPPIADAGPDIIIVARTVWTFDGARSSDNVIIVNWTWSIISDTETIHLFGPGPSHCFDSPGQYTIVLYVKDGSGLNSTDVSVMTVVEEKKAEEEQEPFLFWIILVILIQILILNVFFIGLFFYNKNRKKPTGMMIEPVQNQNIIPSNMFED